jgi:hypothetical protein
MHSPTIEEISTTSGVSFIKSVFTNERSFSNINTLIEFIDTNAGLHNNSIILSCLSELYLDTIAGTPGAHEQYVLSSNAYLNYISHKNDYEMLLSDYFSFNGAKDSNGNPTAIPFILLHVIIPFHENLLPIFLNHLDEHDIEKLFSKYINSDSQREDILLILLEHLSATYSDNSSVLVNNLLSIIVNSSINNNLKSVLVNKIINWNSSTQ